MVIPEVPSPGATGNGTGVFDLKGRESVVYSAYGIPQVIDSSDIDANGSVDLQDQGMVLGGFGDSVGDANYHAGADANANGTIDLPDLNAVLNFTTTQRGQLSALGNTIGFGGAPYDQLFELSHMRNRWYSPWLGRWLTRDPAGYVDGMSQYLYVKGNPLIYFDPFGMASQKTCNHFLTTDNPYGTSGVVYERYDVYKDHGWWLLPGANWKYSETKYRRTNLDPIDITDDGRVRPELEGTPIDTMADHDHALWHMIETAGEKLEGEAKGIVLGAGAVGAGAALGKLAKPIASKLRDVVVKAAKGSGDDLLSNASRVRKLQLDNSSADLWQRSPSRRGYDIKDMIAGDFGTAMPVSNFPGIDAFDDATGIATQIKSIDTSSKSYQSASGIRSNLNKHINDLANFNGATAGGVTISSDMIQGRRLVVAMPESVSPGQPEVFNEMAAVAREQGIAVEYVITALD